MVKRNTIAHPRSDGTLSYESIYVERSFLCFYQNAFKMLLNLREVTEA